VREYAGVKTERAGISTEHVPPEKAIPRALGRPIHESEGEDVAEKMGGPNRVKTRPKKGGNYSEPRKSLKGEVSHEKRLPV